MGKYDIITLEKLIYFANHCSDSSIHSELYRKIDELHVSSILPSNKHKSSFEIIKQFENGVENFDKSPLFNNIIHMLLSGVDEYKVIDSLLKIIDEQHDRLVDYTKNSHNIIQIIKND